MQTNYPGVDLDYEQEKFVDYYSAMERLEQIETHVLEWDQTLR